MILYVTQKQFDLLKRMLPIMKSFYNNQIQPLFEEVAKQYGTSEEDAEKATSIFNSLPVTAPCPNHVSALALLISEMDKAESIDIAPPEVLKTSHFIRKVYISNEARKTLECALDTFSRILMGQFFIIYEQLDANSDNPHIQDAWSGAKWEGIDVREMRDILIPELKTSGWNGSYGIAGKDNKEDSKLAYEMLKVIRQHYRNEYILRVTDQPLMICEMDC